jgi:hypothetical protein
MFNQSFPSGSHALEEQNRLSVAPRHISPQVTRQEWSVLASTGGELHLSMYASYCPPDL